MNRPPPAPLRFAPVLDTDPKEAFHYSIDRLRAIQRAIAKAEMHRDTALRHRHDMHRLMQARVHHYGDPRFRWPGVSEDVCFTLPGPAHESQGGIGREGGGVRGEEEVWWTRQESYASMVPREV